MTDSRAKRLNKFAEVMGRYKIDVALILETKLCKEDPTKQICRLTPYICTEMAAAQETTDAVDDQNSPGHPVLYDILRNYLPD